MPDKPADRARQPPAADDGGETDLRQRAVRRSKRLSTNSLQANAFPPLTRPVGGSCSVAPVAAFSRTTRSKKSRIFVGRSRTTQKAASGRPPSRPGRSAPPFAKKRRAKLAFLSSLSSGLFFAGLEIFFAHAAQGAYPILGYILKSRSRLNARFGVALLGVIHPLAYGTYVFFHVVCFFFGEYFRLLLSNRAQV